MIKRLGWVAGWLDGWVAVIGCLLCDACMWWVAGWLAGWLALWVAGWLRGRTYAHRVSHGWRVHEVDGWVGGSGPDVWVPGWGPLECHHAWLHVGSDTL